MMPNDPTRRSSLSVALLAHTGTDYVVDVFQPGSAVMDGATLPVASYYAACADRLELLWQDGAAGDPGWPKASRFPRTAP